MQKVVMFGALTALFFLFTPATRGQNADEVESLRRENELLKKENELLKKEIELLKKEAKAQPDGASGPKTEAKSITKASYQSVDYELVKCVRDPKKPKKVTFTISANCDNIDSDVPFTGSGFTAPYLILTASGGEALNDGKTKDIPDRLQLKRGVPSSFQISYEEVEEDITQLERVRLTVSNFEHRTITFYNIKIATK